MNSPQRASEEKISSPGRSAQTKDGTVATNGSDDATVPQSGSNKNSSSSNKNSSKRKKKRFSPDMSTMSTEEKLAAVRQQFEDEKQGKLQLFRAFQSVSHELGRTRDDLARALDESAPLMEQREYADRNWYDGGLWRAPSVLPGVYSQSFRASRLREVISLADLFFGLTIVTAFTRVGVAISTAGFVDLHSLLYFAVFWTVSGKEASYSTRFDTTDLSANAVTLVTCFAVLFASLSVQQPINSVDGSRIMIMAAFVAALHILLYMRVLTTTEGLRDGADSDLRNQSGENTAGSNNETPASTTQQSAFNGSPGKQSEFMGLQNNRNSNDEDDGNAQEAFDSSLSDDIRKFAVYNIVMGFFELVVWVIGVVVFPADWPHRWGLFLAGVVLAFRVPMVFLQSDFYASCSKRGVLFTLLLGFLLQSIVVVASEFFSYQTPDFENYCFVGASCLMLFCMKLLYLDDADVPAEDHASKINRVTSFFFNVGQFALMLSTTILGSGLNLLTHDYLSATQALPGPSKSLVCGGFSAVLCSTFFIKSLHLRRVPAQGVGQCLFITAYLIQSSILLAVVGVSAAMAVGNVNGLLGILIQSDILLLVALSGAALVIVFMHWLDEGVELALYGTAETGRSYRVHPFGIWWCVRPGESEVYELGEPASAGGAQGFSGLEERGGGMGSSLLMSPSGSSSGLADSSPSMMSPLMGGSFQRDYKSTTPIATGEFV